MAAVIGTGASAETPAAREGTLRGVTVTGKPLSDKAMIKTVIAPFVAAHAAPDRKSGLLVRGPAKGVCPITLGLPPAFNAFVTARILAVAKQVGAPALEPGQCLPNVEVLFAADPQHVVNALADQTRGAIIGVHFVGETRRLIQSIGPSRPGTRPAPPAPPRSWAGPAWRTTAARARSPARWSATTPMARAPTPAPAATWRNGTTVRS